MKVIVAFLMDMLFGDPAWIPHPVVGIGKSIDKCKKWLQKNIYGCSYDEAKAKGTLRRDAAPKTGGGIFRAPFLEQLGRKEKELAAGGILTAAIVGGAYTVTAVLIKLAKKVHPCFGKWMETFFIFQALAAKCLKQESEKVYDKLSVGDLFGARTEVGWLVGRDTKELAEEEVVKAAVETVAENTTDGVIAPMFYAAIGGAPLAMAYKAVNTLDSMVGYKNEEFLYLGRASARMDDVCNFIPARLSAFAMVGGAKLAGYDWKGGLKILKRDRHCHLSPNSAHTESVAAGALHIQLGGPHSYFGKIVEKPAIGDALRPAEPEDIRRAGRLMYAASMCFAGAVAFGKAVLWIKRRLGDES